MRTRNNTIAQNVNFIVINTRRDRKAGRKEERKKEREEERKKKLIDFSLCLVCMSTHSQCSQ